MALYKDGTMDVEKDGAFERRAYKMLPISSLAGALKAIPLIALHETVSYVEGSVVPVITDTPGYIHQGRNRTRPNHEQDAASYMGATFRRTNPDFDKWWAQTHGGTTANPWRDYKGG